MNKTWLVMRNEIVTNVMRRSWLLVTFGLPLLLALVLLVPPLLRGGAPPAGSQAPSPPPATPLELEGYVDLAGLVDAVPADVAGRLRAYPSEAAARQALQSAEVSAFYIIPADYVRRGDLIYIRPDFVAFSPEGQSWVMRWVLLVNLLGGDVRRAQQVSNPMDLTVTALTSATERDIGLGWEYWIPYATCMILYMTIIMSSSLLRSSTGNERKNRTLEILVSSVHPRQLLTGKVVGLGIVGLVQTAVWVGGGYALLRLGGGTIGLPGAAQLPLAVVAWALVFFLLGYAVYASLLAGLGALTGPNAMGSSTADFVIIWPMVIPLFFISLILQRPDAVISVALSLFPLTAPIAMMIRLAVGAVPAWQTLLAAGLMVVTAVLVLRAVSRVFRAQMLLSGQEFTFKGYLAALVGRG